MTEKIGIIIQARTGSTRLPNKVVLPFYNGSSILDILINKLLVFKDTYKIILATTDAPDDTVLVDIAKKYNIEYYVGDQLDVLKRFVDAATEFNLDTVIRVCADNPFLDTGFIQDLIDYFKSHPRLDYLSFKNHNGTPAIKTHLGLFTEIVTLDALRRVQQQTNEKLYREHVTNYIYANPDKFEVHLEKMPGYLIAREDLRFTIDDREDFSNLKELYTYYTQHNDDIKSTIQHVDQHTNTLKLMINNIKKYEK